MHDTSRYCDALSYARRAAREPDRWHADTAPADATTRKPDRLIIGRRYAIGLITGRPAGADDAPRTGSLGKGACDGLRGAVRPVDPIGIHELLASLELFEPYGLSLVGA